jgi:hypothetical protein
MITMSKFMAWPVTSQSMNVHVDDKASLDLRSVAEEPADDGSRMYQMEVRTWSKTCNKIGGPVRSEMT